MASDSRAYYRHQWSPVAAWTTDLISASRSSTAWSIGINTVSSGSKDHRRQHGLRRQRHRPWHPYGLQYQHGPWASTWPLVAAWTTEAFQRSPVQKINSSPPWTSCHCSEPGQSHGSRLLLTTLMIPLSNNTLCSHSSSTATAAMPLSMVRAAPLHHFSTSPLHIYSSRWHCKLQYVTQGFFFPQTASHANMYCNESLV